MELNAILDKLGAREHDWRREALNLYDQGAFDREVMRELDLTPEMWRVLTESPNYREFSEVVEIGRAFSAAWWETQGRKNLNNSKFNTALYKSMMSNHFGWSDKTEQSMTRLDFSNLNDDDLFRTIKELSAKLEGSTKTGNIQG
jgi:hypothetical protein